MNYVVIPLTRYTNSGYTELKVLGVYFSPAAGGGKIRKNSHFVSSAIHFKIGSLYSYSDPTI